MTRERPRRESFADRRARRAAVDDPQVVLEAAARFLQARPRSVAEVRRRLGGAGYRAELIEGAIAKLIEFGVLDDEMFARAWVESRDRARPRGERVIRQELIEKGIERETIDVVLGERRDSAPASAPTAGPGDEAVVLTADRSAAERLLAKNQRSLDRVMDPHQRRQRAYALLARHGFDPETCREVAAIVAIRDADAESLAE